MEPEGQGSFAKRLFKDGESRRLLKNMREHHGRTFRIFPESTATHFNALKTFLSSLLTSSMLQKNEQTSRRVGQDEGEPQDVTIELAIFVDKELYSTLKQTFPQDTDTHVINVVTAMMNAVQILFDDGALGHKITLVINRLEIMHDEPSGLTKSRDVQQLLDSFCKVIDYNNTIMHT
jgi:hypothetical protein